MDSSDPEFPKTVLRTQKFRYDTTFIIKETFLLDTLCIVHRYYILFSAFSFASNESTFSFSELVYYVIKRQKTEYRYFSYTFYQSFIVESSLQNLMPTEIMMSSFPSRSIVPTNILLHYIKATGPSYCRV